jgi:hypothetical protein
MRKTLAVLALMIGSTLLLPAPVWAETTTMSTTNQPLHHLYGINKTNSYEALTDCTGTVKIRPNSSAQTVTASPKGTKAFRGIKPTPRRYVFNTSAQFSSSPRATCNNEVMKNSANLLGTSVPRVPMARTGRPLVPQLAFAIGLLLVGSLLVALTVRPQVAVVARRRPRPPAAD